MLRNLKEMLTKRLLRSQRVALLVVATADLGGLVAVASLEAPAASTIMLTDTRNRTLANFLALVEMIVTNMSSLSTRTLMATANSFAMGASSPAEELLTSALSALTTFTSIAPRRRIILTHGSVVSNGSVSTKRL